MVTLLESSVAGKKKEEGTHKKRSNLTLAPATVQTLANLSAKTGLSMSMLVDIAVRDLDGSAALKAFLPSDSAERNES